MVRHLGVLIVFGLICQFLHVDSAKSLQLNTTKLIIDSDAGADDAGAILIALKSAYLKVMGITCVNGNTAVDNVVINVLKTLKTANRLDIPVYRGASKPIIKETFSDNYFGQDGFGDFEYPDPPDPEVYLQKDHAVNALIKFVSENPGEITLLCLGPLTNVALAMRMDPLFTSKLKQLVIMGGSTEGVGNAMPGVEFNFFVDPVAAYIVFNSTNTRSGNVNPIVLFPLESVFTRNFISMDWRKNVLGNLSSPEVELLNKADHVQLEGEAERWDCPDCYTASIIADPSIVTRYQTHYGYVVCEGPLTAGALFVDYLDRADNTPNVLIVNDIDVERYKALLLTLFTALRRLS